MSIVEIETEIRKLSVEKVRELMDWLADYHAELWDKQIEEDLETGRLEKVVAEAEADIEAGLARPL